MVLRRLKRPDAAVPLAEKVLGITEAIRGPKHIHTLRSKNNLALTLVDAGEHARAEAIYEELGKAWTERDADAEGSYIVVGVNHAQLLGKLGRADEGIPILDAALARAKDDYPPEFWLFEYASVHRAKLAGEPLDELAKTLKNERARALAGLPPREGPG
jgi:tetratricopeptide (TPR) repeat protein